MAHRFRIAQVHGASTFHMVGTKSTVEESLFWMLFDDKIKELSGNLAEEKMQEHEDFIKSIKEQLYNEPIVVKNLWFEITVKK